MVVEKFSQGVLNSGVLRLYIATGFFATLIFFVINSDLFTPLEMLFGVLAVTVVLKGVSNIMLSLIIIFFSLDNKREELEFKHNSDKIDALLADLTIQDAANN
ncbi:MAG: hypothetical protein WC149_00910 [Arcobacteraceae bacterium]